MGKIRMVLECEFNDSEELADFFRQHAVINNISERGSRAQEPDLGDGSLSVSPPAPLLPKRSEKGRAKRGSKKPETKEEAAIRVRRAYWLRVHGCEPPKEKWSHVKSNPKPKISEVTFEQNGFKDKPPKQKSMANPQGDENICADCGERITAHQVSARDSFGTRYHADCLSNHK